MRWSRRRCRNATSERVMTAMTSLVSGRVTSVAVVVVTSSVSFDDATAPLLRLAAVEAEEEAGAAAMLLLASSNAGNDGDDDEDDDETLRDRLPLVGEVKGAAAEAGAGWLEAALADADASPPP